MMSISTGFLLVVFATEKISKYLYLCMKHSSIHKGYRFSCFLISLTKMFPRHTPHNYFHNLYFCIFHQRFRIQHSIQCKCLCHIICIVLYISFCIWLFGLVLLFSNFCGKTHNCHPNRLHIPQDILHIRSPRVGIRLYSLNRCWYLEDRMCRYIFSNI